MSGINSCIFIILNLFFTIFFSRYIGRVGIQISFILTLIISLSNTFYLILYQIKYNIQIYYTLFNWIESNIVNIAWGLEFNIINTTMTLIVLSISTIVHIYSCSYLYNDPHLIRFYIYINLFTIFMIFMCLSPNFLQFFIGWEGIGLCSYLLINFWFTRIQANKAALKALIVNRIGDISLLISFSLIFQLFYNLDFEIVCSLVPYLQYKTTFFLFNPISSIYFITIGIIIGAVGKSAQFGLHNWLPDAMEGPTPVSALLHAATMVTAGVFLLLKCHFFFTLTLQTENLSQIMTFWGIFTAFFAASIAAFQVDLKKIIAYSTCSQLGYMFFMLGQYQYALTFFHLCNHGFFKALLFLSAGAIIHSTHNNQDTRRYGSLQKIFLILYVLNIIGIIAITGFPFITGFYSKDVIIETTFIIFHFNNNIFYWLSLLTASLTAFYSYKIIIIIFFGTFKNTRISLEKIHYPSLVIVMPLMILSLGSLCLGYFCSDFFIGVGTNTFNFLILPQMNYNLDIEYISPRIKNLPILFSFISLIILIIIRLYFYKLLIKNNIFINKFFTIRSFVSLKFYIDIIYNSIFNFFYSCSYNIYKLLDKTLFEIVFINNNITIIKKLHLFFISFNSGLSYHYLGLLFINVFFCYTLYNF